MNRMSSTAGKILGSGMLLASSVAFAAGGSDSTGNNMTGDTTGNKSVREGGMQRSGPMSGQDSRMGNTATTVSSGAADDIRKVVASTVQSSLQGDFEDVADNLAKPARENIDNADNNERLAVQSNFDQTYRNRYGRSLDWDSNEELRRIFSDFRITKGRDNKSAVVQVPASHSLPAVTLRLRDEGVIGSDWKIEPSTTDSKQIKSKLEQEVNRISQNTSLPADSNQAAAMAAHRVLLALGSTSGAQGGRPGGQSSGMENQG